MAIVDKQDEPPVQLFTAQNWALAVDFQGNDPDDGKGERLTGLNSQRCSRRFLNNFKAFM